MGLRSAPVVLAVAVLATSCASVTPLYRGDRRPREEVGVVRMATIGAITNINGIALEGDAYELLPAKYSIQFHTYLNAQSVYSNAVGQRFKRICQHELVIEAGHEYRIKPLETQDAHGGRQSAGNSRSYFDTHVYLVDTDLSGRLISRKEMACAWSQ